MADRLTVITRLKQLADDPALRGVDRAAEMLDEAARMLFDDGIALAALEKRRSTDRQRQRRWRDDPPPTHVNNVTSRDKRDGSSFSPTPPFPTPEEEALRTAREAAEKLYASSVENLQGLVHSRVGEEFWPDVDAFVKRRQYRTWGPWLKEMLSVLTGGQAIPADLARVCRDDSALPEPLGTPKGLRTFMGSAVRERLYPPENVRPITTRGGVAQRTFDNGKRALEGM